MHMKPSLPLYGAEILAEVVRQTPASLGRTKQRVSACGQGAGIGDGKRESTGGSSAERAGARWAAQPPVPAGTVQRGGGLQLEEVGSRE